MSISKLQIKKITLLFVSSRLLVLCAIFIWWLGPFNHNILSKNEPAWHGDQFTYSRIIDPFIRWDAIWFLNVAREGYEFKPDRQCNLTIFPLYPSLMLIGGGTGNGPAVAGVILSNLFLFLSCILIFIILKEIANEENAAKALAAMLFFPSGFIFSGIYSESLMMFCCAAAIFFGMNRQWALAGIAASAASLTRITGIIVLIPIFLMLVGEIKSKKAVFSDLVWLLSAPIAVLFHFLHLKQLTGDIFSYFVAQKKWGKEVSDPLTGLFYEVSNGFRFDPVFNIICALGFLAAGVYLSIKRSLSLGMFVITGVIISMCQSKYLGMPRYVSVLFPAYLAIADALPNRWIFRAWCVLSSGMMVYLLIRFTNWTVSL